MKRFFPIIISIIMVSAVIFTGCDTGENKLSVKGSMDYASEILTEALSENCTFDTLISTISEWAKENNINVNTSGDKYLVLSKDASETATSSESFVFHTGIDFSSEETTENSISSAAAVMTALYSPDNHGEIKGIFTLIENGDPIGAESLNTDYLACDNFIDITYSKNKILCSSISASSDMQAFKNLNLTSPQYTEAYQITLKGKENQSAYKGRGTYPNAIQTIGDLLASCQSSTILFELASFNGGEATDLLPSNASAVIVIHENDVESFTKKFEKSFKKVENAYEDADEPEDAFEYTMEPVELPSIVISKEDTENIVSLMYTMINGNYLRDEDTDEVMAVSNIGTVLTSGSTFTLGINAKSLDNDLMSEIHTVVETVCGLCDIQYKELSTTPLWINRTDSAMAETMSDAMNIELSSSLESKTSAVFVEKNPDLNLLIWGCEYNDYDNGLEEIIDYMGVAGVKLPSVK